MGLAGVESSFGIAEFSIAAMVFIVTFIYMTCFSAKKKKLPPGPSGFPVIGYLPFLRKDPHLKLQQLASNYGNVFSVYLGSQLVLVLNGVDAVKEGMNKHEFLSRPPQGPFTLVADIPSIVSINGKSFYEQRKFMLNSLKDLGIGKTVLEDCMKDEIEYFIHALEGWKGEPREVKELLSPSMSNNISALVYGERYDYEDPRRKLLDSTRKTITDFFGSTAIHVFFPWVKNLPFMNTLLGYDKALKAFRQSMQFNKEQIEEHRRTLDINNSRDYIDKFILEMDKDKEKTVKNSTFTENMLIGNAGALMGAGSETVRVTIDWCFYLMAIHPDMQKKVQDEIDSIIGSERTPSWEDHKHMPYTQAVLMEIQRWRTIAPLNLLRCTFEDTAFRDYHIPKDTIVLANLWSCHYDPKYWEKPELFTPQRFLSPDGKNVTKNEAYMPFSVGKRSCPGESMAVSEVFIYFTSILQRFQIFLPEGHIPDLEGILTISYSPKPHKLRFLSRASKD